MKYPEEQPILRVSYGPEVRGWQVALVARLQSGSGDKNEIEEVELNWPVACVAHESKDGGFDGMKPQRDELGGGSNSGTRRSSCQMDINMVTFCYVSAKGLSDATQCFHQTAAEEK